MTNDAKRSRMRASIVPTFVAILTACGNSGQKGTTVGPAGGTVSSSDQMMSITFPPGALADSVDIRLTKTADTFTDTSTDTLVPGSTYELDAPDATLATPAVITYQLGTLPQTQSNPFQGQITGDCEPTTPTCYILLGSGECPVDHPQYGGLKQIDGVWNLGCALPQPKSPLLTAVELAEILGGTYDPANAVLTAELAALHHHLLAVLLDSPELDLSTNANPLHAGDPVILTATYSGAITPSKIVYYDGGGWNDQQDGSKSFYNASDTPFGETDTPPYAIAAPPAAPGFHGYYARAFYPSADGLDPTHTHYLVSAEAGLVIVSSGASLDLGATLNASSTLVSSAGSITLTAAPNISAINKVELFEGTTNLGAMTSAPFVFALPYTAANNGNHTYFAKVTDGLGNTANSNNVTVDVAIGVAPTYDYYVDPTNGSDGNAGTIAAPFLSLAHVAAVAHSGQSIGLFDGIYLEGAILGTCDGRGVIMPAGLSLTSVNPRGARFANISFGVASGSLAITDVLFDGGATNGNCTGVVGSSTNASDTITMSGVQFANGAHIVLTNAMAATVSLGSLSASLFAGLGQFADLTNTAQLTVNGGVIDGGPDTGQCGGALISLQNTSHMTLVGVTIKNRPGAVISVADASTLTASSNTIFDHVAYAAACGSVITMNASAASVMTSTLNLSDSTIQDSVGDAIFIRSGGLADLTLSNTTITGTRRAITFENSSGSAVNLTMSGSHITNNTDQGIYLLPSSAVALVVDIDSTVITNNGSSGVYVMTGPSSALTISNSTLQGNGTGLTLDGPTSISATALGNTWDAGVQASDGNGHYVDGTTVTNGNGSGTNFNVINGSTLDL